MRMIITALLLTLAGLLTMSGPSRASPSLFEATTNMHQTSDQTAATTGVQASQSTQTIEGFHLDGIREPAASSNSGEKSSWGLIETSGVSPNPAHAIATSIVNSAALVKQAGSSDVWMESISVNDFQLTSFQLKTNDHTAYLVVGGGWHKSGLIPALQEVTVQPCPRGSRTQHYQG